MRICSWQLVAIFLMLFFNVFLFAEVWFVKEQLLEYFLWPNILFFLFVFVSGSFPSIFLCLFGFLLCVLLLWGRESTHSFLLPYLISFMNDPAWEVAACLGGGGLLKILGAGRWDGAPGHDDWWWWRWRWRWWRWWWWRRRRRRRRWYLFFCFFRQRHPELFHCDVRFARPSVQKLLFCRDGWDRSDGSPAVWSERGKNYHAINPAPLYLTHNMTSWPYIIYIVYIVW